MAEDTSLNKEFGKSFEEKLVQGILGDVKFGEQILDVIDPELFELSYTKTLVKFLTNYYYKYNGFPSVELLESMCKKEVKNKALQQSCMNYLSKIQKKPLNGDAQYVKDNSLKYFKTQYLKRTLVEKVIPNIAAANYDEILPAMQDAMLKGEDRDVGLEYDKDEERFVDDHTFIPTPWKFFNHKMDGGWGRKRLIALASPPGAGKSHWLVNAGVGALKQGKTVVHYTLELDKKDVARRYDANLTGVDINSVPKFKNKVLDSLKENLPENSKLIIKEYPTDGATVQTIKSHLSRLRIRGIIPDLIIIDYLDLLDYESGSAEGELQGQKKIWKRARGLAQEYEVPVLTVAQINRTGYNDELIMPDKLAGDFSRLFTADILMTLARNAEQKQVGVGKGYMCKNRQGEDGFIFAYDINTALSRINIYEWTEEMDESIEDKKKENNQSISEQISKYFENQRKGKKDND